MDKKMNEFDKSLTQAELDAPTFLEWSDATIARMCRLMAQKFHDDKGFNGIAGFAAIIVIDKLIRESNAGSLKIDLDNGTKISVKAK